MTPEGRSVLQNIRCNPTASPGRSNWSISEGQISPSCAQRCSKHQMLRSWDSRGPPLRLRTFSFNSSTWPRCYVWTKVHQVFSNWLLSCTIQIITSCPSSRLSFLVSSSSAKDFHPPVPSCRGLSVIWVWDTAGTVKTEFPRERESTQTEPRAAPTASRSPPIQPPTLTGHNLSPGMHSSQESAAVRSWLEIKSKYTLLAAPAFCMHTQLFWESHFLLPSQPHTSDSKAGRLNFQSKFHYSVSPWANLPKPTSVKPFLYS